MVRQSVTPYAYLEDLASGKTQQWAKQQNQLTENLLNRTEVLDTERTILKYSNFLSYRQFNQIGDQQFYLKGWSGTTTASLYVESVKTGKSRLIAGPEITNKPKDDKQHPLINAFWPSPDGQYVVSHENKTGDRWGRLDLIEVASGKVLHQFHQGAFVGPFTGQLESY